MTARPTEPQKEAVRHARLFFPTSTCLCLLFITAAFASPLLTAQSAWATPLGQEAAPLTTPPSSEAAPAETRIIKGYTLPPEKYEQAVAYSRARLCENWTVKRAASASEAVPSLSTSQGYRLPGVRGVLWLLRDRRKHLLDS